MKITNLFCLLLVSVLSLSAANLVPVSTPSRASLAGAGNSLAPVISADGRHVAFVSQAKNLVPGNGTQLTLDLFVRDLLTGTTSLASVNASGAGGGRGNSSHPSMSADGRWIAFQSDADNLVTNDFNKLSDIFLLDRNSGAVRLVSVNAAGTESASGYAFGSTQPVITPDGRWVIFESTASGLATGDSADDADVFARDMQTGTTVLVSVSEHPAGTFGGGSHSPAPTPNARRIAFVSTVYNFQFGVTNRLGEIYVRDLGQKRTYRASADLVNFPGLANGYGCFHPAISADGRYVVFKAASPSAPDQAWVFRYDLDTRQTLLLATNSLVSTWPAISTNGARVACEMANQLYIWDFSSGTNFLVSANTSGDAPANGISHTPVLTPDGNAIAFLSSAPDLVADPAVSSAQGFQVYVRDLSTGTTRLASLGSSNQPNTRNLEGILPALSADGQRVAFDSTDDTLVPGDLNTFSDVFVRDLAANTTELVSRNSAALSPRTGLAPVCIESPSLSADGRLVAFTTFDDKLQPGDTNSMRDVLVRDWLTGTTVAASFDPSGPAGGDLRGQPLLSGNGRYLLFNTADILVAGTLLTNYHFFWRDLALGTTEEVDPDIIYQLPASLSQRLQASCSKPALSADGRFVAYTALHAGVPYQQLYLRDMQAQTNLLLSVKGDTTQGGNSISFNPMFSPDNRWVVFQSIADDLVTNLTYSQGYYAQLYARDLANHVTYRLSAEQQPLPAAAASAFSASGRYVAFHTYNVSDLSRLNSWSYLYDLQTQAASQICSSCLNPSLSADARWVAFERPPTRSLINNIFLKDMQTGQEKLITTNYSQTAAANGTSTNAQISADGRFVVFLSKASNLVPGATNSYQHVFVYDQTLDKLLLVSPNHQGTGTGNGNSSHLVLSADGTTVAFLSYADDLIADDYNAAADVFVLRLVAEDSDDDGLPDDWEVAYFGDLSRDGSGDDDTDGQTDRAEYLAGTDPTNQGSVLRVLTLTSLGDGSITLLWTATPGKTYRVEYKDDLSAPWTPLPGTITAANPTASALDSSASEALQRFYRVVLSTEQP